MKRTLFNQVTGQHLDIDWDARSAADDIDAARGVLVALAISLPFWLALLCWMVPR